MTKPAIVLMLIATLAMTPLWGQEPAPQSPAASNASPTRAGDEPRPQPLNVRVELTITDTIGAATPQKKTVSTLIADGRMGRIRSGRPDHPAVLNFDATPNIQGDLIRLQLALEYSPPLAGESATRAAHINQFATLLVTPGKPTMVSQAADPAIDRKVTVEVTATILK